MNQQMLDQLIGTTPPSTVDVDGVIRRTLRRRLLRRVAAAGSTAVVVVAVALGAGLAGGSRTDLTASPSAPGPSGSVPSGPGSSGPGSSASGPPVSASVPVDTSTAAGRQRALARVRDALQEAKAEHAPGTAWIHMPDVPGEPRTPDGQVTMWTTDDDQNPGSVEGRSGITGGGRKGGFYLSLRPTGCSAGQSCSPLYECAAPIHACSEDRTPSGSKLVHWVDKPGQGWHFYGVDIALRDGEHALRLQAVNYFGGDGSKPVAPNPVLTRAQLDAIATDVADALGG